MEKEKKECVSLHRLEKAVEILEMLTDEQQDCSVAALSRKAGISRYRTMRLLESLEKKGVVECAVESGRYDPERAALLVQKLLGKAGRLKQARVVVEPLLHGDSETLYPTIISEVRPVMESLARRHNEVMYLTILRGDEVLFIDMVDSPSQAKSEPLLGRRFPFFSNAAGKVMRAIDSWDLMEKIGKRWRRGQTRFPDPAAFKLELELIRKQGVAVDCGGMGDGVITVAVAVRDYAGKVVGALTMLGPSVRLIGARLEEEIIPSLRLSGELLSMKFGYVRPVNAAL